MRCESQYCDHNKSGNCQKETISVDMHGRCRDFSCCGVSRYDDQPRLSAVPTAPDEPPPKHQDGPEA